MLQKIIPYKLIDKYIKGECSPEEEVTVINWYNSFDSSSRPLSGLTERQQEELKAGMLERINSNILESSNRYDGNLRPSFKKYYYISASIAAVLLPVFVFFKSNLDYPNKEKIISNLSASRIHFVNVNDKLHKYTLPDSSIVWLKPQASLSYDREFLKNTRDLSFEGEAFFEIAKNAKHPFVIHAPGIITKVLGTTFNIIAYPDMNTSKVSVKSGKVMVSMDAPEEEGIAEILLMPDQTVTCLKSEHKLIKAKESNLIALKLWEKADLSFENISVNNVVKALSQQFQVPIVLTDSKIGEYMFKGDFSDVNLATSLELLCKSIDLEYHIKNDNTIIINKR